MLIVPHNDKLNTFKNTSAPYKYTTITNDLTLVI